MIELSKLLKNEHSALATMLDNMRTERMQDLRTIQEQLISDPELTTVHLQVTTINGIESLTLHFPNADKRAIWESALIEAKNALMNSLQNDQAPNHLRSILTHRTRPGLTFSVASPTLGKSTEGGAPNVWVCTTDRFSGQVAVVNVNVKPPVDEPNGNEIPGLELDRIFVFNSLDNVRLKSREKMTRLPLPIDDIVYVDEKVFVSLSSSSHIQLLYFRRGKEGNWDMENSRTVRLDLRTRLRPMIAVVSRLCIASANSLYLINPSTTKIEKSAAVSSYPSDSVACMAAHGSTIFVAMNKSTIVKVVNAFTLDCLLEFSTSHLINKTLSTQEDIIRQHKMGCLRISALLCCKNRLWIGTSAGIILNTNIASTKTNWTPTFNVRVRRRMAMNALFIDMAGNSRYVIRENLSTIHFLRNAFSSRIVFILQRLSFSASFTSSKDSSFLKIFVISGGEGYDNNDTEIREEKTGTDDAVNHLLFWTA
uniref:PH domain-containing protein n=1 Tax=Parascaris equorum TaxID=6256 RepID=A0A914RGY2_PAREQ